MSSALSQPIRISLPTLPSPPWLVAPLLEPVTYQRYLFGMQPSARDLDRGRIDPFTRLLDLRTYRHTALGSASASRVTPDPVLS